MIGKSRLSIIIIKCLLITSIFITLMNSCGNPSGSTPISADKGAIITFIEIGSITCIPCQQMRPVMDSIQKKYGWQVSVRFIDAVRNSNAAEPYKIRVMPTQVFLDSNSRELHRHEGFYSEDSIHIFLKSRGLKIII